MFSISSGSMHIKQLLLASLCLLLPLPAAALDDAPLKYLSEAERAYYEKVFDYAMDTVKPDGKYSWNSYSGNGTITLSDTYVSKSGATCRNFAEIFTVQGASGDNEGVGCKREAYSGWCKLKLNDALTCAMERGRSNSVEDKLRDAQEYMNNKQGSVNGIRQMLP